jgi:hypothetical protein
MGFHPSVGRKWGICWLPHANEGIKGQNQGTDHLKIFTENI